MIVIGINLSVTICLKNIKISQMKIFYTTLLLLFVSLSLTAQTVQDGLRYTKDYTVGSARFTGMSGAFSSLGGDLSAVGLNPAGATTFTTNRLSATLSFYGTTNKSNYFDNSHNSSYASFDDHIASFDQLGIVWVYKSDVSDWNKIAFTLNYNKTANYGNSMSIQGLNTAGNSVANYFLDQANGTTLSDIQVDSSNDETQSSVYQWLGENIGYGSQQAFLAYQAYLVNPVDPNDPNNTQYTSAATYSQVKHANKINASGAKSRVDIAIAGTYKKKLQLGFSLSTYSIDYEENNMLEENHYDAGSDLQNLKFRNNLTVEGSGIALKMGAIYKPTNNFRLSLAFHSPQWLEIEEYTKQSVESTFLYGDYVSVSPDVQNSFAPYKIITPSKVIVGSSLVINKKGLISVDYTYQNYANMHFKESDNEADTSYFDGVNDFIADNMKAVHSFNVGGEMKLDKLMLRGGIFTKTTPYKNKEDLGAVKGFSLGLGYTFSDVSMDLGYISTQEKVRQNISVLSDAATVDKTQGKFVLGVRYNF